VVIHWVWLCPPGIPRVVTNVMVVTWSPKLNIHTMSVLVHYILGFCVLLCDQLSPLLPTTSYSSLSSSFLSHFHILSFKKWTKSETKSVRKTLKLKFLFSLFISTQCSQNTTPNTFRLIMGIIILMHVILILCTCLYVHVPIAQSNCKKAIPSLTRHWVWLCPLGYSQGCY